MERIRILPFHAGEDYARSTNGIAARFDAFLRAIREKKVRASKVSCELLRVSGTGSSLPTLVLEHHGA